MSDLTKLQKELLATKQQLAEVVDEVIFSERQIETKEKENRRLLVELQRSLDVSSELEKQLHYSKQQLTQTREQLSATESKLSTEYQNRERLGALSADDQLRVVSLKKRITLLDMEKIQLSEERKTLEEQIEHLNEENDTLREQTRELLSSFDSTKQSLTRLKNEKEMEQTQEKLSLNQVESMRKIIQQLEMEVNQLKEKNEQYTKMDWDQQERETERLRALLTKERSQSSQLTDTVKLLQEQLNNERKTVRHPTLGIKVSPSMRPPFLRKDSFQSVSSPGSTSAATGMYRSPQSSPLTPGSPVGHQHHYFAQSQNQHVHQLQRANSSTSGLSAPFQNQIESEEMRERSSMEQLKRENQTLTQDKDRAENIAQDHKRQNNQLSRQIHDKEMEISRLKNDLSQLQTVLESERKSYQAQQQSVVLAHSSPRTPSSPSVREQQVKLLNIKIENLTEQNKILQEENTYLETTVRHLKEQLNDNAEDKDRHRSLTSQIESTVKENVHLNNQLVQEKRRNDKLSTELSRLNKRINQYETQISLLESKLNSQMESSTTLSQESHERITTLQQQIGAKEANIRQLQSVNEDLQLRISEESASLERQRTLTEQMLDDVRAENALLRNDNEELKRDAQRLHTEMESIQHQSSRDKSTQKYAEDSLKRELQREVESRNLLTKELADIKEQLHESKRKLAPLPDLRNENDKLKMSLEKNDTLLRRMERDLHDMRRRTTTLENEISEHKQENDNLRRIMSESKEDAAASNERVEKEKQRLEEQLREVKDELAQVQLEYEEVSRQNNTLSMKILQQDHEINDFEESKQLIDSNLRHFKDRLKTLEQEYSKKEQEHRDNLATQREDLEDLLDRERHEHASLVSKMREEMDYLLRENKKIRQQAHIDVEKELLMMRSKLQHNNETVSDIKKDIAYTKSGLNQLQKGLHTMLNALTLQEEKVLKPLRQNSGAYGDKKRLATAYVNRITQKMSEISNGMDSKSKLLDSRLQLRISAEFNRKISNKMQEKEGQLEEAEKYAQELQGRLEVAEERLVQSETQKREFELDMKKHSLGGSSQAS